MNRSVLQQSSPVQQMMVGNPNNWWNINTTMRPPPPQQPSPFFSTPPSNFLTPYSPASSLPLPSWHDNQELPDESWSHLLMSGLVSEEDKANIMLSEPLNVPLGDVKQESSVNSYVYGHGIGNEE